VFKATWQRLPMRDRRIMRDHWQACKDSFANDWGPVGLLFGPLPEVKVEGFINTRAPKKFLDPLGAYCPANKWQWPQVRFCAAAVNLMPDEVLSALVAHELGHAYLHAAGMAATVVDAADWDDTKVKAWVTENEEIQVREQMDDWGFHDEDITEWLDQDGNRKRLRNLQAA
jgi:hypothetical protein